MCSGAIAFKIINASTLSVNCVVYLFLSVFNILRIIVWFFLIIEICFKEWTQKAILRIYTNSLLKIYNHVLCSRVKNKCDNKQK